MVDAVIMEFDITLHQSGARGADAPELQIAFVGQDADGARVDVVETGRLARKGRAGRTGEAGARSLAGLRVVTPMTPNAVYPYYAVAVRAMETDEGGADTAKIDRLSDMLSKRLTPLFTSGAIPTADVVWSVAHRAGVSARVYPDLGQRAARAADGEVLIPGETLRVIEDGADWEMSFRLIGDRT